MATLVLDRIKIYGEKVYSLLKNGESGIFQIREANEIIFNSRSRKRAEEEFNKIKRHYGR